MEKSSANSKMWSYKLVYDTMFAPNPLFGVLTLATCKPTIRKSPNTEKGMWIAGWTACTLHNSPLYNDKIEHIERGHEKLIYLAQIDEILPLDEYWEKYPEKRCVKDTTRNDPRWYGDNIYHINEHGELMQSKNNGEHDESSIKRDYYNGKNALICKRFYYFIPDKRIDHIPSEFQSLIHGGIGQSIKQDGELVDKFIDFVTKCALEEGVDNGIVGTLDIDYSMTEANTEKSAKSMFSGNSKKRGGCGR